MLDPFKAAEDYEPRTNDTPPDAFLARLKICEQCPARQGLACCAASNQLCTVLARRRDQKCPQRLWPGDVPAPIAEPPPVVVVEPTGFLSRWIQRVRSRRPPLDVTAPPPAAPSEPPRFVCVHSNERLRVLPSGAHVFACGLHGECTHDPAPGDLPAEGVRACRGCDDRFEPGIENYRPAGKPPVLPVTLDAPRRHLMFHIWPARTGSAAWRWNCEKLLAKQDLFNGRRIVAIASSGDAEPPAAVQEYLRDFTDEFLVIPNSRRLREVATWVPMLQLLQDLRTPQDVTFTCQAKGVHHNFATGERKDTILRWAAAMWETCLEWRAVRPVLEAKATAGSFRRYMRDPDSARRGWGPWMYSGTFFWMRNRDVFARDWRRVLPAFCGTEAWPGHTFLPDEGGVIFGDGIEDLYDGPYWDAHVAPQLEQWRARFPREVSPCSA